MIVMVTGSRHWKQRRVVEQALRMLDFAGTRGSTITILHGAAQGLDRMAAQVAVELGMQVLAFPPDEALGSPQRFHARNDQMLARNPTLVLAFRHRCAKNRGTDSVIRKARIRQIDVRIYEWPPA